MRGPTRTYEKGGNGTATRPGAAKKAEHLERSWTPVERRSGTATWGKRLHFLKKPTSTRDLHKRVYSSFFQSSPKLEAVQRPVRG